MKRILKSIEMRCTVAAALISLGLHLSAGPAPAAGGGAVQTINEVPKVYSPQAIKQTQIENMGIPWFAGKGVIAGKIENGLIVDDRELYFAPGMVYRSEATGQAEPASSFRAGAKIGWVYDSQSRVTSLWLLKEQ